MGEEKNKKIMIVEDDVFVMDIYQTKFSQEGYEVVSAKDGVEALQLLETEIPDIILLDIVMPHMDGLEMLRKLKAQEKLQNIPIILLTNLSQKEEVDEGLGLGANDYLIKSHFTPSEVSQKVRQLLTKVEKN